MGVQAWSRDPDENGRADPTIPATDGAAARDYQRGQRAVMAGIRRFADDVGGAIVSGGIDDAYTVQTFGGSAPYRRGSSLSFIADRANLGPASLSVDGYVSLSLRDRNGLPLLPNALRKGRLARVFYDPDGSFWRLEGLEVVKNDDFDAAPPDTIKGNNGAGLADLTVIAARTLLQVDRVANKSEDEMVAEGVIAEALAQKATPADIDAAIAPLAITLDGRPTKAYVDEQIGVVGTATATVATDVAGVKTQVAAIAAGQSSGTIIANTWAVLAALTPTANARAEVLDSDTGTHTDPVVGGTVPNSGTFAGRVTAPIGWERIGQSTASAAAAQVGDAIPLSPLTRATALQLAFRDPDTKRLTVLSPSDSAAFIQEIAVPTLYPTDLTDVVLKETSSIILPEDPQRSGDLLIQIIDKADAGFNFSSNPAVMDVPGTWGQKSGQWVNHGDVGTKAVAGVVRRVAGDGNTSPLTARVNLRVRRRVNTPMPSKLADAIFSRWTTDSDIRFRDAIRAEVDFLFKKGIYQKLKVWFLPGASRANNMVNLADPDGPLFIAHDGASGSIETAPYKYMKGNGVDQYIDTQRLPADIGLTVDGHFLAAKIYPGGGFYSNGYVVGNSINYFLQPGRNDGQYAFRSGSGLEVNDTPLPNDRWCAMVRSNEAANLTGFVDETKIFTRPRVLTGLPTRTLNLLAGNASPGYGACSPQPLHGAVAGFGLLDGSVVDVIQSNKRIQAVMATIAGA
ncbi:hypothetical protein IPV08_16070 [Methylobacterium sp. SD274]|uniref:hypothetical protein n=1 Tax=Methylobacterium sp. SD274 TaxID=2782009 RepID=UPI001A95F0B6|nr:hypothetical protein [Methylobacterium sp. SD274]MBO1021478.1 hypothetical protein [Methylobacterium sp. SD274]